MLSEAAQHATAARRSADRDPDTTKDRLADITDCLLLISQELSEIRQVLNSIVIADGPADDDLAATEGDGTRQTRTHE